MGEIFELLVLSSMIRSETKPKIHKANMAFFFNMVGTISMLLEEPASLIVLSEAKRMFCVEIVGGDLLPHVTNGEYVIARGFAVGKARCPSLPTAALPT